MIRWKNLLLLTGSLYLSSGSLAFGENKTTQANTPEALATSYLEAFNTYDSDSLDTFCDRKVRLVVDGETETRGLEELKVYCAWEAANHSRIEADLLFSTDKKAVYRVREFSDWNRAFGFDPLEIHRVEVHIKNEKITRIEAKFDPDIAREFEKREEAMIEWAYEYRREALQKLLPNWEFNPDPELMDDWLALLAEWKELRNPPF